MNPDDLTGSLLARFRKRAADYDANNSFFHEDLAELVELGYLGLFTSTDDGGSGLGIEAVARCQRRLATAAPATALAINMHLVWAGIAHLLHRQGDDSLSYVLREAAAGEIYAFGLSEPGNDTVLFDSNTSAVRNPGGGYTFTGTKIFTSLSPVWTRLGVFGKYQGPDGGELVHGFVTRGSAGVEVVEDWDTLGMRASQSNTTRLAGVVVPPERIFRHLPVGPNRDPMVFAVFAVFETLVSAVYAGIADRSLELAVEAANRRRLGMNGTPAHLDPDIRTHVAESAMAVDSLDARLRTVCLDLDQEVDHGGRWFAKLVGLKVQATRVARETADAALQVSGGGGYFNSSEISRLYRDALAGRFHPSSENSARRTVATAWLGPVPETD
ncbi:acyl-CoA dehydrogenase family protein [Arthrobacter sp. H5]|uniref:acyl-CoA dehydrogenase family protein n=1 Tax=Arthrobacter sp. H5 TaxID=1267973 RepID=UPI0004833C4F|nr:acyl-CoA dehydrogenase family protein [Arthrobacter sp. H5]